MLKIALGPDRFVWLALGCRAIVQQIGDASAIESVIPSQLAWLAYRRLDGAVPNILLCFAFERGTFRRLLGSEHREDPAIPGMPAESVS